MNGANYIALAIPVFFLMIGVEILVARLQRRRVYRFNDAITDLSCGIGQQVTGIFIEVLIVGFYAGVYKSHALFSFERSPALAWIICFLGVDFSYYWWHRTSHRMNLIWATHVVHHQSQDYNLAVALRQPWFAGLTSAPYYIWMAFAGVPPVIFLTVHAFSLLYQFWIHTETVKSLGPFEWVFNSPSHHRVHHAINPEYIDKNYAATLIIWDRLFGTYQEEDELCVYGTVKPYESWNSLWANFDHFAYLAREAKRCFSPREKIALWFKPPEWRAGGARHVIPPVDRRTFKKFDLPLSESAKVYVAANFVITTVATTMLLFHKENLSWGFKAAAAGLILATLLAWSGFFEGRRWALPLELARVAAVVAFFFVFNTQF